MNDNYEYLMGDWTLALTNKCRCRKIAVAKTSGCLTVLCVFCKWYSALKRNQKPYIGLRRLQSVFKISVFWRAGCDAHIVDEAKHEGSHGLGTGAPPVTAGYCLRRDDGGCGKPFQFLVRIYFCSLTPL